MTLRGMVSGFVAFWLAGVATGYGQATAPDERGLWLVWCQHTNAVSDHAAAAKACRDYRTKAPRDPLAVVAQGLEAWHLLKAGHTNEAVALLEAMRSVTASAPLQVAGVDMARGWLTRLDREGVRRALKAYYVKAIEFPASLDALKTLNIKDMPAFSDRWGVPWDYRLSGKFKGLEKQQYLLESTHLEATSDLTKALAVPYASRITLEPVGPAPGSTDVYEFASPRRKSLLLQAGREMDGMMVAYLGTNLIVLSDGSHWRVVAKPR